MSRVAAAVEAIAARALNLYAENLGSVATDTESLASSKPPTVLIAVVTRNGVAVIAVDKAEFDR